MTRKLHIAEAQLELPAFADVVQTVPLPQVTAEDRITLGRLVSLVSENVAVSPEPELEDYEHADSRAIESGLYIPYSDPEYQTAQQLVRLGVDSSARPSAQNVGVVFPSDEYPIVARNARDLARSTEARTQAANESEPNRDQVRQKVGRSVAHTLNAKISSIATLNAQLTEDRETMRSLYKDLRSSWIAHYKVKNLDKKRAFADEQIHEAAEVSSLHLNLGTTSVQGLHRAIRKNLYGGNRTHGQIAEKWRSYINMVGSYMGARIYKLDLSQNMCEQEMSRYEHFLRPEERAA